MSVVDQPCASTAESSENYHNSSKYVLINKSGLVARRETTENLVRSSSPAEKCAICLCMPENRSYTDSCFHEFCFVCLVEWSKARLACYTELKSMCDGACCRSRPNVRCANRGSKTSSTIFDRCTSLTNSM